MKKLILVAMLVLMLVSCKTITINVINESDGEVRIDNSQTGSDVSTDAKLK